MRFGLRMACAPTRRDRTGESGVRGMNFEVSVQTSSKNSTPNAFLAKSKGTIEHSATIVGKFEAW